MFFELRFLRLVVHETPDYFPLNYWNTKQQTFREKRENSNSNSKQPCFSFLQML